MSKVPDSRFDELIKDLHDRTKDLKKLIKKESGDLKKLTAPLKVVSDFKKKYDINDAEQAVASYVHQMIELLKVMDENVEYIYDYQEMYL